MAFQTRGRDPLFDSNMQAAIEKRGRELAGLALLGVSVLLGLMLASYSPQDPSWISASDAPVENWLGLFGSAIAAPFMMILGLGSWALVAICGLWGLRFGLHRVEDGTTGRLVFAPIWVAIVSIYASALVPSAEWTHAFGMGGLFGDTVLGAAIGIVPLDPGVSLNLLALALGFGVVALGIFVGGVTLPEARRMGRYALIGLVLAYAGLRSLVGLGATGAVRAADSTRRRMADRRAQRREAREDTAWFHADEEDDQNLLTEDWDDALGDYPAADPIPAEKPGLLGRLPGLIRRPEPMEMPQDELVERDPLDLDIDMPGDERIKAKIASVVRSRARRVPTLTDDGAIMGRRNARIAEAARGSRSRSEPPLTGGPRGPAAEEPPLTQRAIPPAPEALPGAGMATPVICAAAMAARHSGAEAPMAEMAEPLTAEDHFAAAPAGGHVDDYGNPQGAGHDDRYDDRYDAGYDDGFDGAYDPRRDAQVPGDASAEPVRRRAAPDLTPADSAYDLPPEPGAPAALAEIRPQEGDDEPLPFRESTPPRMIVPKVEPRKVVEHPPRKPAQPSTRARAEAQPGLQFDEAGTDYELPPLSLLTSPSEITRHHLSDEALEENARMLENVLDDYGVKGEIVSVRPGPVVTMYELEPAPGLKASRVIGLSDDIARSMSALSARVSTVPGRSVIGIELPNDNREMVVLREILSAREFGDTHMKLPLALGKDIGGESMVANLAKMPHLLIAGTTGSGKSVAINTMILSLLYRLTPDECRLIMIDPKMLELSVYDGIPHLLSPVVTDPKKAVVALKWVVGEMEERYRKMSKMGVRNIDGYNGRVSDALAKGETFSRTVQTGFDDETGEPVFETEEIQPEKMPYIVVIVDEMADLMMVAGKEIEACIQRLAQMARASGIHLIMATQRPSVDVITGTIKANFPTRISFQVTSKIDSRTILGEMGAEQLLGMGDMLYMAGGARITRCHGPFVSDEEVEEVVRHLKSFGPPSYIGGVVEGPGEDKADNIDAVLGLGGNSDGEDALYDQAVAIVAKDRKCSTSYIQRKLAIGYNKAARLVEQMEDQGVVSPANHVGKREVLVPEPV
ncbi:DNA translocase FtsK [Pseudooceanicola aestuarii]|uniref:DNA translocase FtsK n=1 Tax=Pseudooceanicola aestuarii TaxID=2697319 RepID=UPI0013D50A11|nr:DNA translocase FtsK [Pseudooceanicola aestuarii]